MTQERDKKHVKILVHTKSEDGYAPEEWEGLWAVKRSHSRARGLRLAGTRGHTHTAPRSIQELRRLHAAGELKVLGEVMAQYEGARADDPRLEPYWALAEELDIPVAFHLGPGGPDTPYGPDPDYRAGNGSPLQLEPILLRHPRLRIYVMHAGYPFADDMRALMFSHPQSTWTWGASFMPSRGPHFTAFSKRLSRPATAIA